MLISGTLARNEPDMYYLSLRLEHDLPFSNVSRDFPEVEISRWCNREVDILEVESRGRDGIDRFEAGLRDMVKGLSARLIHVHRYSEGALEAVVKCRCASSNSSIAVVEASSCIPVMPVTYAGGIEHLRLFAFTKEDQRAAIENLGEIAKVTVEGRGQMEQHSARPAMTVSIDDILGKLTRRQLFALVGAIEMGYYSMPKRIKLEQVAAELAMPRSTFEEHLRKAEVKVMQTIRPYARIAYLSDEKV